MINIYAQLKKIAKTIRMQNLFSLSKEQRFPLFYNSHDLSNLQHIFLSYLHMYEKINEDIVRYKISESVFKDEIYEDAYWYWRIKKGFNFSEPPKSKKSDVMLTKSNTIKFKKGNK